MRVPSGDHRGDPPAPSRRCPAPPASMIQSSDRLRSRMMSIDVRTYTTRLPSGEICGSAAYSSWNTSMDSKRVRVWAWDRVAVAVVWRTVVSAARAAALTMRARVRRSIMVPVALRGSDLRLPPNFRANGARCNRPDPGGGYLGESSSGAPIRPGARPTRDQESMT